MLERFGEVRIVDEANGFGLDFVEKTEGIFLSTTLDMILGMIPIKTIVFSKLLILMKIMKSHENNKISCKKQEITCENNKISCKNQEITCKIMNSVRGIVKWLKRNAS